MKSVLLKGGLVIDPAQNLEEVMNVLLADGKVAKLGKEDFDADIVIDCTGKVVAPGFIDIHMHEDGYDEENDRITGTIFQTMVRMGVTTAIAGNCGDNDCDPLVFLDSADRNGLAANVGMLAGHTYLRNKYSDQDKYHNIEKASIEAMAKECARLLDGGCLGVSFGLKYIPGTTWDEIISLASLCKKDDKLVAAHVRDDVERVFDAAKELADIGKDAGVKVQFSHIGSMGGYGQMAQLLSEIEDYQKQGIDMMCDCYPYEAFSTGIGETTYDDGFLESYQADYDSVLICSGPYAGQRCTEELFFKLRKEAPETYTVGYFMKPEDIDLALSKDYVMIGSDGIRAGDEGHPRGAGAFPRFFAEYVKTGKITLMDAVAKMTIMPAARLGLKSKGSLASGMDADVTIFDMETIKDKATYDQPVLPPEGICHVIVGGQSVVTDGVLVNETAGKSVRR